MSNDRIISAKKKSLKICKIKNSSKNEIFLVYHNSSVISFTVGHNWQKQLLNVYV